MRLLPVSQRNKKYNNNDDDDDDDDYNKTTQGEQLKSLFEFHVFSLPLIYFSVCTFLKHICPKQI